MSLMEKAYHGFVPGKWRCDRRRDRIQFYVGERAEARRAARNLFGSALSGRQYAGLAGAPWGAEVEVGLCEGQLTIEISDPQRRLYSGLSRIYREADGLVLVIEALHIHRPSLRGRGLGQAIFQHQLHTARQLGVERINTCAGRRRDENGYYSWPRYGFDGRLPQWLVERLPRELCPARCVLDIMTSPQGRQWWLTYGITLDVVFDVHADSRSSRTFQAYLNSHDTCGRYQLSLTDCL